MRSPEHLGGALLPHAGVALQVLIQPEKNMDEANILESSHIKLEDKLLKDIIIAPTQLSIA